MSRWKGHSGSTRTGYRGNTGYQPEGIGNRKGIHDIQVVADDIGNRYRLNLQQTYVKDDIGNSIEYIPTHLGSGILQSIEGKQRQKENLTGLQKAGPYWVGGVNPRISGAAYGFPRAMGPKEESDFAADRASPIETLFKRWFEQNEEGGDYILKSTPEEKRIAALQTVSSIMQRANVKAEVDAIAINHLGKDSIFVFIEESLAENEKASMTSEESGLWALNLIVNKIVNRYPDDRIRLAILPKSQKQLCMDYVAAENKVA